MKTNIKKIGDTMIVSMNGQINYEMQEPLKNDLTQIANNAKTDATPRKIIFDLKDLEFVGSSGISSFVQALKDFNANAPIKPRYCNVKSEFRRIIKALDDTDMFEFFENEDRARKSFDQ